MAPEDAASVTRFDRFVTRPLEDFLLGCRFLLVPLYCALMYLILRIILDFFQMLRGSAHASHLIGHTLEALELLDITMIANLIWFISAGSYYVFVHPYPDTTRRRRPRSLAHISTGILKEKMASSLIGVSSVYLLQMFLNVSASGEKLDIEKVGVMLAIHIVFIIGLIAFNYTNKADHRTHDDKKDPGPP